MPLCAPCSAVLSSAHPASTAAVNDPPTAVDDSATTDEDTPVTIAVLDNDSDPVEGDTLTVTAAGSAAHGTTAVVDGGNAVEYTPDLNFHGGQALACTREIESRESRVAAFSPGSQQMCVHCFFYA